MDAVRCDGCGDLAERDPEWDGLTTGWWLLAEMTADDNRWEDETELHACSAACAAAVLAETSEARDEEDDQPVSGHPRALEHRPVQIPEERWAKVPPFDEEEGR